MTVAWTSHEAGAPRPAAGRARPPAATRPGLLSLQRHAGNRATAALLEEVRPERMVPIGDVVAQRGKTDRNTRRKNLITKGILTTRRMPKGSKVKTGPKHAHKYSVLAHGGRSYYYRTTGPRVVKMSGPIGIHKGARSATMKVPNKRKGDVSAHLIAHSFGGPPKLAANYVAMKRQINAAGGHWGRFEQVIRDRLAVPGTRCWMSVKPQYTGTVNRPTSINVTMHFNRSPQRWQATIATP